MPHSCATKPAGGLSPLMKADRKTTATGLNAAGRAVWEGLGYEVRAVDCTTVFRHFGCLHCLVNVLSR